MAHRRLAPQSKGIAQYFNATAKQCAGDTATAWCNKATNRDGMTEQRPAVAKQGWGSAAMAWHRGSSRIDAKQWRGYESSGNGVASCRWVKRRIE